MTKHGHLLNTGNCCLPNKFRKTDLLTKMEPLRFHLFFCFIKSLFMMIPFVLVKIKFVKHINYEMKNILLVLSICFSVSNCSQYNSMRVNSKKASNAYYLKNILPSKDDSFFDQTLIYPNPVKKQLKIRNAVLDRITVYDTLGQLQKSFVFLNNTKDHFINLFELSKGVYFMVLENENKMANRKIIID